MITRKALKGLLEESKRSEVLISRMEYYGLHPVARTPIQQLLSKLLNVKNVEARYYTDKRGNVHSSPRWLIDLYKCLVRFIGNGYDIQVGTMLYGLKSESK